MKLACISALTSVFQKVLNYRPYLLFAVAKIETCNVTTIRILPTDTTGSPNNSWQSERCAEDYFNAASKCKCERFALARFSIAQRNKLYIEFSCIADRRQGAAMRSACFAFFRGANSQNTMIRSKC